jgi:hypothetical protein
MILARIKNMYKDLPNFLKSGVEEWQQTFATFDNGSRIIASATSEDALRSESINVLICDEFAFVPKGKADQFWSSNYPTVSASEESKIIIISTPNGMFNLFHQLWTQAEAGQNSFIPTQVTWYQVPGRDTKWAQLTTSNIGKVRFRQEFAVEFLGSTHTVIDPTVLEILLINWKEPDLIDMDKKLKIYEKPNKDDTYIVGVDVSKGSGRHYSVAQVLKLVQLNPVKL